MSNQSKQNEALVTHIYTADPSAHVFEGKIYIYPSHDLEHDGESFDDGSQYAMEDYHVFSMENESAPVVDHGEVLHVKDIPWASKQMWAPDAAYKNGKYYLVYPAKDHDGIFRIGIATSDNPAGPFKPEENYIPGSYSIDPAVLIDDDNKAYCYIGGLWGGQLEQWQTGSHNPEGKEPAPDKPAYGPRIAEFSDDMLTFKEDPKEISIVDSDGNPILAGDEDRRFFEGAWVHKYDGRYYLSYSTGTTHKIVYAVGDNPYGPFEFKGTILNPVIGWTTHHSIVQFNDKWYLFYHDASLSNGINHQRSIKFTEITYDESGNIQTIEPYENK
ncbi:glycoside hydrolase family 43 protein [Gracilibacillus kekensis]|uniref:Glycosyl hydrolases family 43 n=1 Tax=Gracilibacillus kekensis TaxID=1027249 RepID=A0A1M7IHX1_9BACI|nr:glycoside hydrolase family 43 protein [Gracilibacillus kekensis]SHM40374.1 Glycosyl hydrolases family 43 [Gracilibacillus kekensis]